MPEENKKEIILSQKNRKSNPRYLSGNNDKWCAALRRMGGQERLTGDGIFPPNKTTIYAKQILIFNINSGVFSQYVQSDFEKDNPTTSHETLLLPVWSLITSEPLPELKSFWFIFWPLNLIYYLARREIQEITEHQYQHRQELNS